MKILVTGASGFVGRRFLEMAPVSWEIICLGRSNIDYADVKWVECDLSSKESLKIAADVLADKEFDVIVHLAAFVPKKSIEDSLEKCKEGNIDGTINLLTYFGKKAKKIVIGSTVEAYDKTKISGPITEDNVVSGSSYYSSTKIASEVIAQSFAQKNNKELTILRFSIMYGGYDPIARAIPNFIRAAKSGDNLTINGPLVLRDYVHIDDVASSIICAVNSAGAGVINIGTGRGVSIKETAESIIKSMRSSSCINIMSDNGGCDIVIDISKAESLLDYHPKVFFPNKIKEMGDLYENCK